MLPSIGSNLSYGKCTVQLKTFKFRLELGLPDVSKQKLSLKFQQLFTFLKAFCSMDIILIGDYRWQHWKGKQFKFWRKNRRKQQWYQTYYSYKIEIAFSYYENQVTGAHFT